MRNTRLSKGWPSRHKDIDLTLRVLSPSIKESRPVPNNSLFSIHTSGGRIAPMNEVHTRGARYYVESNKDVLPIFKSFQSNMNTLYGLVSGCRHALAHTDSIVMYYDIYKDKYYEN